MNNITAYQIALIAGGFTIIGVLLGTLLSYCLSRKLIRETHENALQLIRIGEFNKAASKFREVFLPIRIALNPAEFSLEEDLSVFLENNFNNLRRAVIDFSDFLDSGTKSKFLDAWHEYYRHPDHRDKNIVPFLEQYSCHGLSPQKKHEMKQLVQSRIEKILEFAKPK